MIFRVHLLAAPLFALSTWIACDPAPSPPKTPATAAPAPAPSRAARRALKTRGMTAYDQKDFRQCAQLLEQALDAYDAACCHAQAGNRDAAFTQLRRAIDDGFRDQAHLEKDTDLASLHGDPRWPLVIAQLVAKNEERRKTLNAELMQLHDEDQGDRAGAYEQIDWTQVTPRDQARRKRIDEIIASGGARVADDYYHAAMVYQHGDRPEEIQRAHDLAIKAVELDPKHDRARWLAAAAEDRKLMYEGKPQKWGTQFKKLNGTWVLWQVDPAITDEQREAWNVPPLAESQAHAVQMNAQLQK
jgi:tetratricopeptide (TPR) repeat protein